MVAANSTTAIAWVILLVTLIGWIIYIVANRKAARPELGAELELAANRRPYFDDEELEGKRLERVQMIGLLFLVVLVIGLPLYWVLEPGRMAGASDQKDATFFVTIQGYSMIDVGLLPGDKAVIDRSKLASVGDIILAIVNGEFTIKVLGRHGRTKAPRLLPANAAGPYSPIEITEGMDFEIWGVCTGSFRRF